MKTFPIVLLDPIAKTARWFTPTPINKEMPEPQARKSARTRKKKATKKQLKALEQLFAK